MWHRGKSQPKCERDDPVYLICVTLEEHLHLLPVFYLQC